LNENSQTTSEVDKLLTIEIKRGLKENTKFIFPSKGDQGPNKLQGIRVQTKIIGDIVFILKQLKHESFSRSGDDLIYTSKIPLLSALTGTNLSIKTLDGRSLNVPINETVE
jgi:DnaJ-class molecular chaperone